MKPFIGNAPELAEIDTEIDPEEILEPELGLEGLDYSEDEDMEGLGYVGLGRVRRRARKGRRRRHAKVAKVSRRRRRRHAKVAKVSRRRRRRHAKVAKVSRPRRHRRIRRAHRVRRHHRRAAAAVVSKPRRRRRRTTIRTIVKTIKVPGPVRRIVRIKKVKVRGRKGRRRSAMAGFGGVLSKLADTVALQSISSLGEGKKRKSRRRKARRLRRVSKKAAAPRRRRRRGHRRVRRVSRKAAHRRRRRRGGRRMSGLGSSLGSLGRMGAHLADAEVSASWPVLGPLQYAITMPGLEALGGVTLAGFLYGVVQEGLFGRLIDKTKKQPVLTQIGTGLISSIAMWELGRLVGSGNLAKFGAFYALGKMIDSLVMKPYVVNKIFSLSGWGLGTMRVGDETELRGLPTLGQARVSDDTELRGEMGQRVVTEEELLGEASDEGASEEDSALF